MVEMREGRAQESQLREKRNKASESKLYLSLRVIVADPNPLLVFIMCSAMHLASMNKNAILVRSLAFRTAADLRRQLRLQGRGVSRCR